MTAWRTTFPFRDGDVFFCRGNGWLDKAIRFFQARKSKDGDTRSTHTGIVLGADGTTFETTPWRTGFQSMGQDYAGSDIAVLRWRGMTPTAAAVGFAMVARQRGRIYPYWRLAVQAVGLAGALHGQGMECCVLAAHFLRGAGCPLAKDNLWAYDTEGLYDELRGRSDFEVVFDGSLRAAGYIVPAEAVSRPEPFQSE